MKLTVTIPSAGSRKSAITRASIFIRPLTIKRKDKTEDKDEEDDSWTCYRVLKNTMVCIVSVAVVYGILGVIIAEASKTETFGTTAMTEPTTHHMVDNGCGADSFMIRDGVCDEATNNERCLFDGGDCCLDVHKKETSLCRTCTCELLTQDDQLEKSFQELDVRQLKRAEDFSNLILTMSHLTTDVTSKGVCTTLCLIGDLADKVNGWSYDNVTRTCTCAWLESTECIQDVLSENKTLSPHEQSEEFQAYIQMTKFLNCNCFKVDAKLIVDEDSSQVGFLKEDEIEALSAWHCQRECQLNKICTIFSWQYDKNEDHKCNLASLTGDRELVQTPKPGWLWGKEVCFGLEQDPNLSSKEDSGWYPNNYLIADGACDELTNNEEWLFDGGDCCVDISKKDSSMCIDCTCKLKSDTHELEETFLQLDVRKLEATQEFLELTMSVALNVGDVLSSNVCSALCLDPDLAKVVNGWKYDNTSKNCTCAWLEDNGCIEDSLMLDKVANPSEVIQETAAYIQRKRSLACSCIKLDAKVERQEIGLNGIYEIIDVSLDHPGSAWHCRKMCQEQSICSLFLWKNNNITHQTCTLITKTAEQKVVEVEASGWLWGKSYCHDNASTDPNWMALKNGMEVQFWTKEKFVHGSQHKCREKGGRLFEPRNREDMTLVSEKAFEFGIAYFWIGISDAFQEGNFSYVSDGTLVPENVTFWKLGEPDNSQTLWFPDPQNWVIVESETNQWMDLEYNNQIYYEDKTGAVCERETGPNLGVFTLVGGTRIYIAYGLYLFQEAVQICSDYVGGRIFEPRNATQVVQVVWAAMAARLERGYWIGITYKSLGGYFYHSDGQPLKSELNWVIQGMPKGLILGENYNLVAQTLEGLSFYHPNELHGWSTATEAAVLHAVCELLD